MGFFPVDDETLAYLRLTGRPAEQVDSSSGTPRSRSCSARPTPPVPEYTKRLSLDLGTVEPSLAGPKRPQDRVPLADMKQAFAAALTAPTAKRGFALDGRGAPAGTAERARPTAMPTTIGHGAVVIAAITSCTNTSNPERDAGRRPGGQEGGRQGADRQALGEDQPRPRHPRGDRLPGEVGPGQGPRRRSASTPSATAARPASATAARCPSRWPRP